MKSSIIVEKQRKFYDTNITKNVEYRINALKKLKQVIIENEEKINMALKKDLSKSEFESYMCEIGLLLDEITYTIKNVKKWSKPKKVRSPISQFMSKSFICSEAYGLVLIIAPWNYPFLLSLQPLISAIAAGNCCIIKPSEYSKNTSSVIKDIINKAFAEEYVSVVEGGIKESQELLKEKFDYIFYTGSSRVAKVVMENASKNLIPVTLELGGKSPCIIDETANLELSAKRIIFGKILNAGQTCVAPDYILVHNKVKLKLIENIKKYIVDFLGENPINNSDYPRIINEKNFIRLKSLLEGENIIYGGRFDKKTLKIEPTIIDISDLNCSIMQEEIFGPILPIISFDEIEEVIEFVKKREKPLALYLFTENKNIQNRILNEISFGGGCVNDTVVHLASSNLCFGGIGLSGMGSYHGKFGFDTFTHYKSILKKSNLIDLPMRYHKYTKKKLKLIKMFLK